MKKIFKLMGLLVIIGGLYGSALAITWFSKEFTCPIDNEKNTFLVVGSYGSYIYSYPSKYQWLFFPYTDSPTYYICKKCHLTTYMWDFDKLPKEKIPELRKLLVDIEVSKNYKKQYTQIPVTERLEIMEKVYGVLNKDKDWWEQFYRVKGYHYGKEGKAEKAASAREKSLELVKEFLNDKDHADDKKILFYISGAMKHFLNNDKGALEDLNTALATKTVDSSGKASAEEIKNYEDGLNERIKDYIEKINSTEKPRMADKENLEN